MESNQRSPSYYTILGVSVDCSGEQIRRAYRKLAMQWHPDKWTKNPAKAKCKFQQIQEAYSVLSDQRKRSMYDVGLFNPQDDEEEEDEGFADFMQEMSSLMKNAQKEEKKYSLGEIQNMFKEMAQSFNQSASSCFDDDDGGIWSQETFAWNDDSGSSKRDRADKDPLSSIGMQEARCV